MKVENIENSEGGSVYWMRVDDVYEVRLFLTVTGNLSISVYAKPTEEGMQAIDTMLIRREQVQP